MDLRLVAGMTFEILGGLGIFLLGMKNMSEGMQAIAGDKLRKLINAVTNNRFVACGVGTAITCLVQSSSVTTVMVVGMVNAGVMTLVQSIGVILGANIGTTITGWILALKIGKYGLQIIGVAAFIFLFTKRERLRYIAMLVLGLGMIFFGLQLMKRGFSPLGEMPEFEAWFYRFSPTSYFGVLKCCLVGAILTAILQSSSATLGITMALAFEGVIDYPTAAALVLGENIGTTVTAYLASLGTTTVAKRAAYAHVCINLVGVFWITAIFSIYLKYVQQFIGIDPSVLEIIDGKEGFYNTEKLIAATHTGFNVVNAIIFLPLIGLLAKLLCRFVPDKEVSEPPRLTALDVRMLDTPTFGIDQSQKEIFLMADETENMMDLLQEQIAHGNRRMTDSEEKIFEHEIKLDLYQKELVEFLGKTMVGTLPRHVVDEGRRQLRMADEYESIGDYITNIHKLKLKMLDTDQQLSEQGLKEINQLHDKVSAYLKMINRAVRINNHEILGQALPEGDAITRMMKQFRTYHLDRVGTGVTTPLKSLIYTDMLNAYRRTKDHALNIAEVIAGEK
jgi:phosphate:Na+ symporter